LAIDADKEEYNGVRKGLRSMRVGERCLLHVDSTLAYGEKGHFSFPHIDPHANMVYDVILIGFEEAENVRTTSPRVEYQSHSPRRGRERGRVEPYGRVWATESGVTSAMRRLRCRRWRART